MSLFDQLKEKPWLTPGKVADRKGSDASSLAAPRLGLRMLMGVITVLFSLLVAAYSDRMGYGDWRPLHEPWLLWLNTAMLTLSSVGLQWASVGVGRGQMDRVRDGLLAGGAFAFIFLAGQLLVSQQLVALGYFAATNPANAFFYLITGLHAAHLFGGLAAWGWTTAKVWRGYDAVQLRLSVELCAVYWHFLLVVWLVLFGLLLLT